MSIKQNNLATNTEQSPTLLGANGGSFDTTRGRFGLAFFAVFGITLCVALTVFLISLRLEKALGNLAEQRVETLASEVSETIDQSYRVGLRLDDMSELERKISEQLLSDKDLLSVSVFDDSGKLFSHKASDSSAPPILSSALSRRIYSTQRNANRSSEAPQRTWRAGHIQNYLVQARDEIGRPAAVVWMVYDVSDNIRATKNATRLLINDGILVALCLSMLVVAVLLWLWRGWAEALGHAHSLVLAKKSVQPMDLPGIPLEHALQTLSDAERDLIAINGKILESINSSSIRKV